MEELLERILKGQSEMLESQSKIINRLDILDNRLDHLESKAQENATMALLSMKCKLLQGANTPLEDCIEDNKLTKPSLHETDELYAKCDCLLHDIITKDSIIMIDAKLDVLSNRFFQQEAKLLGLIRAKNHLP